MIVNFPGKVFARNTGGNSTYANNLVVGLRDKGVSAVIHNLDSYRPSKTKIGFDEATLQLKIKDGLLHFPSDTGMIVNSRKPVVSTIHGVASLHILNVRGTVNEKLWRVRVALMGKSSNAIVTPSNSSKEDLIELFGFSENLVHVIPHGISHEEFNPQATPYDEELKYNYAELPENFALYLGNLDPRKNVKTVLRALDNPMWPKELSLVIAGNMAWGSNSILNEIIMDPRVLYLGQVSQKYVAPLYRKCAVFLFPSLYEGFGFPVLEALACGAPVVTTTRGSLKDLVSDKTVQILDDPMDAASLASLVRNISSSQLDISIMSSRGIEYAKCFTWSASVEKHIEVYRTVL